jgi:diaminopimelate epimerase
MQVSFTKMHGLGNDFVVIDAYTRPIHLNQSQIKHIADRHFGVGCDQLLIVEKPHHPEADFRYRIFNADGGEVEQCGNGARCFVRFVHEKKLTSKTEICVETAKGLIYPRLESNGLVTVNMGNPRFDPADIPFEAPEPKPAYTLMVMDKPITIYTVSMGNPHAVQIVDKVSSAPVSTLGPLIENHPLFPERVNAGFMQIVSPHSIKLRVYERGSGETLACGTGACAAAVTGIKLGLLVSPVRVQMNGGELSIEWKDETSPVMMTGPAISVFEGVVSVSD